MPCAHGENTYSALGTDRRVKWGPFQVENDLITQHLHETTGCFGHTQTDDIYLLCKPFAAKLKPCRQKKITSHFFLTLFTEFLEGVIDLVVWSWWAT